MEQLMHADPAGFLWQTKSCYVWHCAVEVPEEPEVGMAGVVDLGIRLPHGERLTRRFLEGTQTRAVAAFVAAKGVDMTVHHFETSFPKTTLTADETTLAEAGIRGRSMLMVVRNNS
eukprot:gene22833-27595_t